MVVNYVEHEDDDSDKDDVDHDGDDSEEEGDSDYEKDCVYHDGYLDFDYDVWVDHDERCHGTIDSMELRIEYQHNYVWDGCDQPGDSEGCKTEWHKIGKRDYHAKLRACGFKY